MTLALIAGGIKEANTCLNHIDNFNIRNSHRLGMWLELAYELFQEERTAIGLPRFSDWCLQELGIKDTRQRDMRNFARLCSRVPKILRCHLPVYFFVRNHKEISNYFTESDEPWTHELFCNCDECELFKD